MSAEDLLQLLCIWRCQSSVIRVDVSVSTRWQQSAAVSTTRTVDHSILSTALSVETLVGEARLSFSVQRQVHSNKLGDGGVLPVWTQSGQHCAYGFLFYRQTQAFDSIPFDLTLMGVALVRWIEVFRFIIQRVYIRWTDY